MSEYSVTYTKDELGRIDKKYEGERCRKPGDSPTPFDTSDPRAGDLRDFVPRHLLSQIPEMKSIKIVVVEGDKNGK